MNNGKVLIAAPVHPVLTDGLTEAGYELSINENISQGIAPALVKDCVGIITSTRLLLNKELLDAAPELKWIGRMGSGMEIIDTDYAQKRGIRCFSSPEGNSNAVAEHALGMLLALNKNIVRAHNEVARGVWKRDENRGFELEGKTIGIIGFGHTGRAFAKKLSAFDMQIIVYDKYTKTDIPPYVTCCDTLEDIFERAEIVSFHVPLQPDTTYYFNENFINSMKNPFTLINTSRGKVMHTEALLGGLYSGKVKGACLDVWEEEPLEKMSISMRKMLEEIMKMSNVVVTPHIAGYSFEALYKMSKALLDKIVMK